MITITLLCFGVPLYQILHWQCRPVRTCLDSQIWFIPSPCAFFSFVVLLSRKICFLVSLSSPVRHGLFLRFPLFLPLTPAIFQWIILIGVGVDDLFSGLGLLLLWGWVDHYQRFSTNEGESWLRSERYAPSVTATALLTCQACQTCINVTCINKIVEYLLISLSYPLKTLSHPLRKLNYFMNKLREWSTFTYAFFINGSTSTYRYPSSAFSPCWWRTFRSPEKEE